MRGVLHRLGVIVLLVGAMVVGLLGMIVAVPTYVLFGRERFDRVLDAGFGPMDRLLLS